MVRRLVFDPSVPDDLRAALDYYERISSELANRFRCEVNQRLDDVAENPEMFSFDVPPIHFANVGRFPYITFFVERRKFLSILAIVHGASDPEKWRERSP